MADLPTLRGRGFFFIGDAHVAATPPGHRQEGYLEQVLAKIDACLSRAAELDLVPVFLGDLFHWPRDNPNYVLVELLRRFAPHKPLVLVGNHDKYQARYTDDVSMAVLAEAGVIRLMADPGPAALLEVPGPEEGSVVKVLLGATPDGFNLPKSFDRDGEWADMAHVLWVSHHNLSLPAYPDKAVKLREIPGVDWVVNGHIHSPQPMVVMGSTRYANPGNLVRLSFTASAFTRKPVASVWRPGYDELEAWEVPVLPAGEVFPDQEPAAAPEDGESSESRFLRGLERLAARRTAEGAGLKEFLELNLAPGPETDTAEADLIWELYEEVVRGPKR